ncbi:uncharacterized protein LOC108872329 isoform X2 [Brassica rapa]|uniref:uncharacterized protein LOC106359652 n=1 Tax=Brassica napus TaxID=3708 RepID=UPI0006AAB9FD|nr:uncharacterized protein LOC108872329 isoform X2 [Brassica rapa]XP_048594442.1 uncharacterized protein LOC106359652 [Brassica napus]
MESLEAVSSGSPLLQPEPPDPDIDVMLLVVPPVPPVPPDPPPVLLGCAIIRQISLSFTTPHHQREPEAPLPWFLCASTSFSLKLLCSDAEAGVVELFVARFLGFLIAKCKLTSLHCSSFQVLEDWTSNGEILEFSVKAYPSFEISGTCCWTHLPLLHASARWFALQHSIFQKRCLVASEVVDVSSTVGYVENFPTCSANGMWIEISALSTKAVTLQKAPRSTASSGLSCLQILSDSIVSLFALRSGLDLIEITGFFIAKNLVPLVTLFSCSSKLSTTLCLVVVFAKGVVPKHCSSSTLF